MLVLSEQHAWQGSEAVRQVLVFTNQELKDIFDKDFATEVEKHGLTCASDSNLGAIFKVRAVKSSGDGWITVVRCGITGATLYDNYVPHSTPEIAISIGLRWLFVTLTRDLSCIY